MGLVNLPPSRRNTINSSRLCTLLDLISLALFSSLLIFLLLIFTSLGDPLAASGRRALAHSSPSDPRHRQRLLALFDSPANNRHRHHLAEPVLQPCPAEEVDHMPCEDPRRSSQLSRRMNFYRERHYPLPAEAPLCLVPPPEGYRSPMQWPESLHKLKALGIDNILGFDWLASPPPESMIRALEVLYSLGILDEDSKLTTPIGYQVAEMPLDPMISKMIIAADTLGCSEEILTIAAVLSVQSIWVSVRGKHKGLDEVKLRFAAAEGDHVTHLNVYKGFHQSGKSSQWCYKNYINYHAMKKVVDTREQLSRLVKRLGIVLKSCEGNTEAIRKAILAGFFSHASQLEEYSQNGMYKTVRSSQEVYIHPSSVLFRVNPKWVVYHSLVYTDKHYMHNVIAIDPSWLIEAAPHFYQLRRPNPAIF